MKTVRDFGVNGCIGATHRYSVVYRITESTKDDCRPLRIVTDRNREKNRVTEVCQEVRTHTHPVLITTVLVHEIPVTTL